MQSSPHVSANHLGEYLVGSPAARKRIVHTEAKPVDPALRLYTEARTAITEYLCQGLKAEVLEAHRQRLVSSSVLDEHEARRVAFNVEALHSFEQLVPSLGLDDLLLTPAGEEPPALHMAGVTVLVRPQVVLQRMARTGGVEVGVLKLYFSKTHPMAERAAEYVATTLHLYAEQHLAALGPTDAGLCRVVDVFAGRVYRAPKAMTRRVQDMAHACEEIGERWPT